MDGDGRKIPEFWLLRDPVTDEAKLVPPFKWAAAEVGKRHKLGKDLLKKEMDEYVKDPSNYP